MDNQEFFKKNKYCIVKNVLSGDLTSLITDYCFFDEKQNSSAIDVQVPEAYSKYGDALMESLLIKFLPVIEENTGLSLYPTYSYYRIYRNGDILFPHKDRPSCEISATLFINKNYNFDWPIYMDENKIVLDPGDLVIYKGCDVEHWREELVSDLGVWHVQSFLHYVDKYGEYSSYKYDNRESLGELNGTKNFTNSDKSDKKYIIYT